MHSSKTPVRALFMLTLLGLVACSTKPIVMEKKALDNVPTTAVAKCNARAVLIDARPAEELGNVGFRELQYGDYVGWLDRQIGQIFVARAPAGDATVEPIKIDLLRSYIESNRATLSFNVVLRVNGKIFRGQSTRVNWFGGQSELANFIERASIQALTAMRAGLEESCKQ
jgi:hypothetical protein